MLGESLLEFEFSSKLVRRPSNCSIPSTRWAVKEFLSTASMGFFWEEIEVTQQSLAFQDSRGRPSIRMLNKGMI